MKMVWHHDELMQQILSFIAILEKRFDENFRILRNLKNRMSLPAPARYKIRAVRNLPMLQR